MDDVDKAAEHAEAELARSIRFASKPLQPGAPGECEYCGEESQRLINGACAPCRDRRKLP